MPDEHGKFFAVETGERRNVGLLAHAVLTMSASGIALLLSRLRRLPDILLNIRKVLSTGWSMPFLESTRKPAKYGWSSNSKAHVSAPSRFTPCLAARSCFRVGNLAMAEKALLMFCNWLEMPMRTWPSTNFGCPLAWKEIRSIGVPFWPVTALVPSTQWARKRTPAFPKEEAEAVLQSINS